MKVFSKIIQWSVAAFFALLAFGTGSVASGIVVFIAALLMAPIKPIRNFLFKFKIKSFVAIILSIILCFVAIMISPTPETPTDIESSISTEDSTTNDNDVVESTKKTNTESTTGEMSSTTEGTSKDETEKDTTKKVETTTKKTETTTRKTETTTKKTETTTKKTETTTKKTETTTKRVTTTVDPDSQVTVYVTETGKRYHYENPCGNGTYYPSTLANAKARGLTPCDKCVLH